MLRVTTLGLAALLLCGAAGAAGTTLYKWVDAQGVVHYSDSPQPGAEKVDIQPVQTYQAPPAPQGSASRTSSSGGSSGGSSSGSSSGSTSSYTCAITAPQPDQSFFSPDSVTVAVSVTPGLQDGDQLQILFDGTAVPPTGDLQATIQQPARGSHSVGALVREADGKLRCNAAPVTFNVQRPSMLSPQSPQAQSPGRVH